MNNLTLTSPTPIHHQIIDGRTNLSTSYKRRLKKEIDLLIDAGIDPVKNQDALKHYAQGLSGSSRAFLKASLALLYEEDVTRLEASATPDNLSSIQARLLNIKAMTKTIQVKKQEGTKAHVWLSLPEVDRITSLPNLNTLDGFRDYIVLALLLGAGLRADELSNITFDSIVRLPNGNGYRDVINLTGKGDKLRPVPISPLLSQRIHEWKALVGGGRIARSINKSGVLGNSLSDRGIFNIVREYGALISHPTLDPHDARRSFGRLGYEATKDIILIRDLLGHASSETTEIYIGLRLQLDITVSDFIIKPSEFFMPVSGD